MHCSHWISLASNHSRQLLGKRKTLPWWKNNYLEPNKITLVARVDNALQQSLKKENVKLRFKVFGI
jgi:hypothetical protein